VRLNEIYLKYRDRMQFLCVYIQEAHPEDGWQTQNNIDAEIRVLQPRNSDERAELAGMCVLKLNLLMPMVLDNMENDADALYGASPERLYLVDSEGRVAYRGKIGPWGFKVDAWEAAIMREVEPAGA
jgi:hypothetical protein